MRICLIKLLTFFTLLPSWTLASVNSDLLEAMLMNQSEIRYHETNEVGVHQIVLSTPKRINNEIYIEKDIRQAGKLHLVMTSLPQTKRLVDGFEYYRDLLVSQGELLYSCTQRACGVSSYWANDILGDRDLTGRDSNQYYVAGKLIHAGNTYVLSVYMATNALRQNLALISIIKQSDAPKDWHNGFFVETNTQLPAAVVQTIKDKLTNDTSLSLYVANFTNKASALSVTEMEKVASDRFSLLKDSLSKQLGIESEKIKQKHIGSFHEQIMEEGVDAWSRLYLFTP